MDPYIRPIRLLDDEHEADHDMADNRIDTIEWRIVGLMMVERLAAARAVVVDLQNSQPAAQGYAA
jgi:hypothetical protein